MHLVDCNKSIFNIIKRNTMRNHIKITVIKIKNVFVKRTRNLIAVSTLDPLSFPRGRTVS